MKPPLAIVRDGDFIDKRNSGSNDLGHPESYRTVSGARDRVREAQLQTVY